MNTTPFIKQSRSGLRRMARPRRAWMVSLALLLALLSFAPAGAASAAPQLQDDDCSGSIAGQVVDEDGAGIEGVRVLALPMATGARPVDPNVEPPEATTDAEGNYEIEDLCAGAYMVIAMLEDPNRPLRGFHDADADGKPDILVLADDDTAVEEIDIVLGATVAAPDPDPNPRPAPRQCAIDDGVITGTVTKLDGDAVEGAMVVAFQATASGMPATNLAGAGRAMTDVDGMYRIEGMCEGRYFVLAQLRSTTGALQGHHDADADGRPDVVGLSEDAREAEGIDIVLDEKVQPPNDPGRPSPDPRPQPPQRPEPPRAPRCAIDDGTIRGTITDPNGAVVEGAQVLAVPAASLSALGAVAVPVVPVRSTADGTYEITGLCEGAYQVLAFLPSANGMHMGFHDADGDGAPDTVSLKPNLRLAEAVDIQLVSLMGPGLPGGGRTMPLPRPAPLPLPPASGW